MTVTMMRADYDKAPIQPYNIPRTYGCFFMSSVDRSFRLLLQFYT